MGGLVCYFKDKFCNVPNYRICIYGTSHTGIESYRGFYVIARLHIFEYLDVQKLFVAHQFLYGVRMHRTQTSMLPSDVISVDTALCILLLELPYAFFCFLYSLPRLIITLLLAVFY